MEIYARVKINTVKMTRSICTKSNPCPKKSHMETEVTFKFYDSAEIIPNVLKIESSKNEDDVGVGFYEDNDKVCCKAMYSSDFYDFTGFDLAFFQNKKMLVCIDDLASRVISAEVID